MKYTPAEIALITVLLIIETALVLIAYTSPEETTNNKPIQVEIGE